MSKYFDNSATTKPDENVIKTALKIMEENYANPASLHSAGTKSFVKIEEARETVAKSIFCDKNEIIFTSGGTESNNIAVIGVAQANRRNGNRIITTKIEHPSVENSVKALEKDGFEIVYIDVDKDGNINEDELLNKITAETILISVMLVNNETGLITKSDTIKKCIEKSKSKALFHIDAVQAYGKIEVDVRKLGCDLLSVSAHKIHGLKGVGALYIKKGTKIKEVCYGGNQEKLRSGTQPTELICGFAEAVRQIDVKSLQTHFEKLRCILLEELKDTGCILNSPLNGQSGLLNISFPGVKSEVMLHFLSEKGFFVSSGSACSKGKKSVVLSVLGIPDIYIDGALRISFSKYNSEQDIYDLSKAIKEGLNSLVKKR